MLLPTTDAVRALGERLIGADLIVFPVRHHSPACAWQLRRLLNETRVCAVLVEGPRSFTRPIPQLTHAEARMPLAIYSYAVFKAQGDECAGEESCLLPVLRPLARAWWRCVTRSAKAFQRDSSTWTSPNRAKPTPTRTMAKRSSLLDERHFRRSRYLGALASQLGCRDHEELWEHLFEVPAAGRSPREHVTDMAAYCHLARVDCDDEELQADGTLQREAEMARHIQRGAAERRMGDGPVLAVLGGFHAVVMHALLWSRDKKPAISKSTINDAASALIRYGFDRLDRLNGYCAGMTSPAWHQQLWERMLKHDKVSKDTGAGCDATWPCISLRYRARTAREAWPTAADAHAHCSLRTRATARSVAATAGPRTRRRARCRDQLFRQGRNRRRRHSRPGRGAARLQWPSMGQVPPGVDRPPLVRDFEDRARRQKLKIDDWSRAAQCSRFIGARPPRHQSSVSWADFIGYPDGARMAGPDFVNGIGLDRLQEHWEYTHSAATEAALVEASVYGTTVPLAVANRFGHGLERSNPATTRETPRPRPCC